MIYYDTSEELFKVYENSGWQILSSRDYADSRVAGFDIKESCAAATVEGLTATYANGTSGVGATLTGAGALPSIDGVSLALNARVLVRAQGDAAQNGVYKVTALSPFVLTRAVDFDDSTEVNGGEVVFIKEGTTFGNCSFVCLSSSVTFGTTAISFTQISGTARTLQQYYATGNQITTGDSRDVIIEGSEKLEITASNGMEISGSLSAGETLLSSASVTNAMDAAAAKFSISNAGNIKKLNNVSVSFPTSASQENFALVNDGSGTLSFGNLAVSNLNDVGLASLSSGEFLEYDAATNSWVNDNPATTASGSTSVDYLRLPPGMSEDPAIYNGYAFGLIGDGLLGGQQIGGVSGPLTQAFFLVQTPYNASPLPTGTIQVELYATSSQNGQLLPTGSPLAVSNTYDVSQIVPGYVRNEASFTFSSPALLSSENVYALMIRSNNVAQESWQSPGVLQDHNDFLYTPYLAIQYDGMSMSLVTMQSRNLFFKIVLGGTVSDSLVTTDTNGKIDSSFLQFSGLSLGGHVISGIASPSVSTDLANKAYVDSVSLQALYNQDTDGLGAIITTDASDGDLIIEGSEKLHITADSGLDLAQILSVSGSMVAGSLVAGNGSMSVSASGDLGKIKGVSYVFPASQATGSNYTLVNDGSGNLSWGQLKVSEMNDALVSTASNQEIIQWNGSNWVNVSAVTSGSSSRMFMTTPNGRLDTVALQHNLDFGVNVLSNILAPVASTDAVPKYVADDKAADSSSGTGSVTLQLSYGQDVDGSDVLITTNSVDGILEIAGSEAFLVSAGKGFLLADNADASKFSKVIYKHELALSANQSNVALADVTFDSTVHQGCLIEYRIKDDTSGASRIGLLLVSTDGTNTTISDSFAETSPLGVSWSVGLADGDVEVRYTTNSTSKRCLQK
jgi:hypothetical protein